MLYGRKVGHHTYIFPSDRSLANTISYAYQRSSIVGDGLVPLNVRGLEMNTRNANTQVGGYEDGKKRSEEVM